MELWLHHKCFVEMETSVLHQVELEIWSYFSKLLCLRLKTHSKVTGDVGSSQDPSGCWEKNGKHREEGFFIPKIWSKVLHENGSCQRAEVKQNYS